MLVKMNKKVYHGNGKTLDNVKSEVNRFSQTTKELPLQINNSS